MPNRSAVSATSVGCFIWSAICFRLYQKARSDVKELSSAVEITPSTLHTLPEQLEKAPKRRMFIKINGFLHSPKPIVDPENPEVESVVVKKKSTSWATNRSARVLDEHTSVADDIQIKLKAKDATEAYIEGPTLHLSQKVLEDLQPRFLSQKETYTGNRYLTALASSVFLNFTWRMVDTVEVVPQGKPVFAAVDAVADFNGRITLIESPRISRRKIVTFRQYNQIIDETNDHATVWKGFAITSACVGSVLAAAAAFMR